MAKLVSMLISGLNWLINTFADIAGYFVLIVCVGVSFDVMARFLFDFSTQWSVEFTAYLFVGIIFLGLPYTTRHENGHVKITVFFDKIPLKYRKWMELLNTTIFLVYTVFIGILSWESVETSIQFQTTSRTAMDVKIWPYQLFIPVGLFITSLLLFLIICEKIKTIFTAAENSTGRIK